MTLQLLCYKAVNVIFYGVVVFLDAVRCVSALDAALLFLSATQRKRGGNKACYDALQIRYQFIWGVLDEIIEDSSEKAETKAKAAGISNMFRKLKNVFCY